MTQRAQRDPLLEGARENNAVGRHAAPRPDHNRAIFDALEVPYDMRADGRPAIHDRVVADGHPVVVVYEAVVEDRPRAYARAQAVREPAAKTRGSNVLFNAMFSRGSKQDYGTTFSAERDSIRVDAFYELKIFNEVEEFLPLTRSMRRQFSQREAFSRKPQMSNGRKLSTRPDRKVIEKQLQAVCIVIIVTSPGGSGKIGLSGLKSKMVIGRYGLVRTWSYFQ